MKVSVIVPVYNVERYLARCLDSIMAAVDELKNRNLQSSPSVEVICVNDGSTDGSAAILAQYADRAMIITKANGGLGSARNAGLDAMTGDYVTFVDSDDWIPRHAIARFVEAAEASRARLVVSTRFAKDAAPPPTNCVAFTMRPVTWLAGRKVQYCAWNKLYAADLFRQRRYPATIYEDLPVTTDILCEAGEFAAIDEPLYVYCRNEGATSLVRSAFTERKLTDSIAVVRMTLESARRQTEPKMASFAFRQAAAGHSSTVGQVWKSGDPTIGGRFLRAHAELIAGYPEMARMMRFKARMRLMLMKLKWGRSRR